MTTRHAAIADEGTPAPRAIRYDDLARSSNEALEAIYRASPGPSLASLVGSEFRGFNTPPWARLVGIQKFVKGFFDAGAGVEGYNLRAAQTGLEGPWSPGARAFGFYTVRPVDEVTCHGQHATSVLRELLTDTIWFRER